MKLETRILFVIALTSISLNVFSQEGGPMGGDLHTAPAGKAPTFLVGAMKDPIGGNLDRYQIVKGCLDGSGL